MKTAGWRSAWIYGCVIALCQPLAACGDAAAPTATTAKQAAQVDTPAIPADAPLVIAFGDSLYAGYRLGPREGLAPQLQAALAADGRLVRVQNAGVSGDTTAPGPQRHAFVLGNPKTRSEAGRGRNRVIGQAKLRWASC